MFQNLWEIWSNEILIIETPNINLFIFQTCHFFSDKKWTKLCDYSPCHHLNSSFTVRTEVILWTKDLRAVFCSWFFCGFFATFISSWRILSRTSLVCLCCGLLQWVEKNLPVVLFVNQVILNKKLQNKWNLKTMPQSFISQGCPFFPQIPCIIARFQNCKIWIFQGNTGNQL